jgi:Spy/CpxP family protein refolding chaperone
VLPISPRTSATLLVVVAFIAGLFFGVAGDHLLLIHRHEMRRGQFGGRQVVDRLDRELHLTSQQKTQIQGIVDHHRARMDAIMSTVRPQMRQEIDAGNAEIEKLLTPEQRVQFQHLKMRLPQRKSGPPPPPPDSP